MAVFVILDAFDADAGVIAADLKHHRRIPLVLQIDVARHPQVRQRSAPFLFAVQLIGGDLKTRPAPDAPPAVILLQLTAQSVGRDGLHLVVDGRAHGQTAGKELPLAEIFAQLATDFVGEVIPRRQFGLEALEITVLDRAQRLRHFGFIDRFRDIAILFHLAQHEVPPRQQPVLATHRVVIRRRLGQRGEEGRLMRGQLTQRLVEIRLACRRHAIGVLAEENLVQIELKNFLFAQGLFKARSKDDLLDFTLGPAVARQKEVLHHLLGDRRGPAHVAPARFDRIHRRRTDAAQVIALMGVEVLVLCRDEGLFHQIRDGIGRGEKTAFLGEFVDQTALARVNPADRWRRVLRQRLVAGQISAIHPEHRPDGQSHHADAQGQGGKDPPEKGQNKSKHARGPPLARDSSEPIQDALARVKTHGRQRGRIFAHRESGQIFLFYFLINGLSAAS